MDNDAKAMYVQENRRVAERILIFLEGRRLLRDRAAVEEYDECRKSAHQLRKILENEMLTVSGGGFLLTALRDMRAACENFVSAAGPRAQNFKEDDDAFRYHLLVLREVFAQRIRLLIEEFNLQASQRILDLIDPHL